MASRDAGNVLRPVAYLVGAVSDAQQQDAFHLAVASRQEMEETLYLLNSLPCLHDFVKEVSRRTRYKRVGVLQTVSAVLGRINVNTHRKKSGAERAPPQQHQQTAAVAEAAKLPVSKRTLQVTQRILSDLVVFATGTRRGDPFDPSLVRCVAAAVCVWCSVHAHAGCRVCVCACCCVQVALPRRQQLLREHNLAGLLVKVLTVCFRPWGGLVPMEAGKDIPLDVVLVCRLCYVLLLYMFKVTCARVHGIELVAVTVVQLSHTPLLALTHRTTRRTKPTPSASWTFSSPRSAWTWAQSDASRRC